ncbi:hypothetical protein [Nocardioides sp. L-11A]|uniref:hypothetical protein n=1 Tax=Nocardioides sp. L-11A TaxID=3043848 RepID=UPI002499B15F|nr:hypothetical protein QJ852_15465 [Nocardioides sp. L-11A]
MAFTPGHTRPGVAPPPPFVTAVGASVAVWCGVFAAISVWFEVTDKFASGPHAADADALSVVNWYVAAVKLVGVATAVLAVVEPPSFLRPRVVGVLLWAAFATVTIYVAGSLAQAVAMLTGMAGDAERLDLASAGYVLAFLLAAAGFGLLAFSYAGRAGLGKREVLLGICGAPLVLGSILVVLPMLLRATGLLSP